LLHCKTAPILELLCLAIQIFEILLLQPFVLSNALLGLWKHILRNKGFIRLFLLKGRMHESPFALTSICSRIFCCKIQESTTPHTPAGNTHAHAHTYPVAHGTVKNSKVNILPQMNKR
jgi:hypothetical protein